MTPKFKRITTVVSLFLVFAVSQIYGSVTLAGPQPATVPVDTRQPVPQQTSGVLTTQGNKGISINGATAISGATILSGASIETPDGVGGTVNLGSLGSLQIDANTKLTLEFQSGSVKIVLLQGCVVLHTKKGTTGEISGPQGAASKTDPSKDGVLRTCAPGSVLTAPAAAAGGGGGLFGIGTAATLGVIGGVGEIITPMILGGANPSP
jgi:hypothetical protein